MILLYLILRPPALVRYNDKIIEIGAVKISKGKLSISYSTFVNPEIPIPYEITQLTPLMMIWLIDAPIIEDVLPEFLEFCKGSRIGCP